MPILRELYQTLNRFLHCGPMLDARTPLRAGPVRLGVLRLIVKVEGRDEQMAGGEQRRDVMENLGFALFALHEIGIPSALVRRVVTVVTSPDGEGAEDVIDEWMMSQGEHSSVPEEWARFGFQWGVAATHDCL